MSTSKLCCIRNGSAYTEPEKMTTGEIVNALNSGKLVYEVNPFNRIEMIKLNECNFNRENFSGIVASTIYRRNTNRDKSTQTATLNIYR